MRKNILFLSLLCSFSLLSASCDDEDTQLMPPPVEVSDADGDNAVITTQLAWKTNKQIVAFLNDAKDIPVTLYLNRMGNTNTETVKAQFGTLNEEELNAYNTANRTSYTILPEAYYTFDEEIKVSGTAKKQEVTMIVKNTIGALDLKTKQYAIPMRVTSSDCEVKAGADVIMVVMSATTPEFSITIENEEEANAVVELVPQQVFTKEYKMFLNLNVDNRWANSVTFKNEEADLNALLDAYKAETGKTEAKLLPADLYAINDGQKISFAANEEGSREFTVNVTTGSSLEPGEYVLPVALSKCEGMPFSVSEKVIYLQYNVLVPIFSLKETGLQLQATATRTDQTFTKELTLSLNITNKWEANISFENEDETLSTLVNQYNDDNGTSYTLLPAANRILNEVKCTGETKEFKFSARIKSKGLTDGTSYLFPVVLKGSSENICEVNTETVSYLLISKIDENVTMEQVALTADNIHPITSESDSQIALLVDGDVKSGQEWQSAWNTALPMDKIRDAKYGIYIDIDNISIDKLFQIKMNSQTVSHNGLKKVAIYAGTSADDLTEVWSTDDAYPEKQNGVCATNILSTNGKNISLIRIAALTSYQSGSNGKIIPLTGDEVYRGKYNNKNWVYNIGMNEIELYVEKATE